MPNLICRSGVFRALCPFLASNAGNYCCLFLVFLCVLVNCRDAQLCLGARGRLDVLESSVIPFHVAIGDRISH